MQPVFRIRPHPRGSAQDAHPAAGSRLPCGLASRLLSGSAADRVHAAGGARALCLRLPARLTPNSALLVALAPPGFQTCLLMDATPATCGSRVLDSVAFPDPLGPWHVPGFTPGNGPW